MKRRQFIEKAPILAVSLPLLKVASASVRTGVVASRTSDAAKISPRDEKKAFPARHWERLENKKVKCVLCPKECKVADLERGYCGARENRGGEYYSLVYARPCSINVDPIEKKPLFHFKPGSQAFSLATAGCNFECKFCQNWEISQMRPEQVKSIDLPPAMVVKGAKDNAAESIAFTYTEPVIFQEYVLDTAIESKKQGIATVVITNGFIQKKPLLELCAHVPAIKVDLKAFTEKFYKESCAGELKPVLAATEEIKKAGVWLELVVLIIPGLNDSPKEIEEMTKWVRANLGKDVPVHFTRFHPMYKMKEIPSTPVKTIERARDIGMSNGLDFVYVGNVPGHPGENTYCPKCKEKVIERYGFFVRKANLKGGSCAKCGNKIAGIFS